MKKKKPTYLLLGHFPKSYFILAFKMKPVTKMTQWAEKQRWKGLLDKTLHEVVVYVGHTRSTIDSWAVFSIFVGKDMYVWKPTNRQTWR